VADRYSSAEAVRARTGVRPDDLGQETDEGLDALLEGLLDEATDLVDRRLGRSYLDEASIPAGLQGIVADIAADAVRTMVATRQTPVVRIDDFAVRTLTSRVFSPDIRERLRLYGTSGGIGSVTLTSLPAAAEDDLVL
jgi:hypothetical protein